MHFIFQKKHLDRFNIFNPKKIVRIGKIPIFFKENVKLHIKRDNFGPFRMHILSTLCSFFPKFEATRPFDKI